MIHLIPFSKQIFKHYICLRSLCRNFSESLKAKDSQGTFKLISRPKHKKYALKMNKRTYHITQNAT